MSPSEAPVFTRGNHVMIDIETLSTRSNAAITSIGACKFNFIDGITQQFKMNIDPASSKKFGLHIDMETVKWWSTQSKEARHGWQSDPQTLEFAMDSFNEWIGTDKMTVWAHGASFDFSIIQSSYVATKTKRPWKYTDEMCLRTTLKLLDSYQSFKNEKNTSGSVNHDSIADAVFQTKFLLSMFDVEVF